MTGKNLAVKLVMKWIFDPDVEKLRELQEQQILYEKNLFKIENSYQQGIKALQ
jgi:hypothetical protein